MIFCASVTCALLILSHRGVFSWASTTGLIFGSVVAATYMLSVPMILLSMVDPFVIKLLTSKGKEGRVAGRVFSLSTVGGVLGSITTAYIGIPLFGLNICFLINIF